MVRDRHTGPTVSACSGAGPPSHLSDVAPIGFEGGRTCRTVLRESICFRVLHRHGRLQVAREVQDRKRHDQDHDRERDRAEHGRKGYERRVVSQVKCWSETTHESTRRARCSTNYPDDGRIHFAAGSEGDGFDPD